jgi:hypothetical protein
VWFCCRQVGGLPLCWSSSVSLCGAACHGFSWPLGCAGPCCVWFEACIFHPVLRLIWQRTAYVWSAAIGVCLWMRLRVIYLSLTACSRLHTICFNCRSGHHHHQACDSYAVHTCGLPQAKKSSICGVIYRLDLGTSCCVGSLLCVVAAVAQGAGQHTGCCWPAQSFKGHAMLLLSRMGYRIMKRHVVGLCGCWCGHKRMCRSRAFCLCCQGWAVQPQSAREMVGRVNKHAIIPHCLVGSVAWLAHLCFMLFGSACLVSILQAQVHPTCTCMQPMSWLFVTHGLSGRPVQPRLLSGAMRCMLLATW